MKTPATGKGVRKRPAAARKPRRPPGVAAKGKPERPAAARSVHPRNKLNALSGEEWLFRSRSVLQTAYASAYGHALRKAHGANKPPQLMKELIEFFTKPGGCVLDPFAGVGGTLIGASLAGRRAIGIEINPAWGEIYERVCAEEGIRPQTFVVGDCLKSLDAVEAGTVDFVATDPPYNRQFERTMCNGVYENANRRTDFDAAFSELPDDFSNSASYGEFLDRMERLFEKLLPVLRPDGYAAVILRNAYQDGEYMMTQADVAERARRPRRKEGGHVYRFVLKGEIIWYQAGSRLRPYGYPYAFVPNISHQTIVVLRKERLKQPARRRTGAASGAGKRP